MNQIMDLVQILRSQGALFRMTQQMIQHEPPDACTVFEGVLRDGLLENNMTLVALSDLAKRFRDSHLQCFHNLHVNGLSLRPLKTKCSQTQFRMENISILALGNIQSSFCPFFFATITYLRLLFNVDGLRLRKCSFAETWAILMWLPVFRRGETQCFPSVSKQVQGSLTFLVHF